MDDNAVISSTEPSFFKRVGIMEIEIGQLKGQVSLLQKKIHFQDQIISKLQFLLNDVSYRERNGSEGGHDG